ncbi:MAG: EI24 domain-containing protein, partial [Microbacterium sp.]
MREFVRGMALLGRGFGYWRRRPGLMVLGLIPAAIVGILLLAGIVALAAALPGITVAITPFADGWPGLWATVFRATLGTAMVGAAVVLVAVSFTALTLIIGEPFYERIWRSVERDLGDADIDAGYGFWRSVRDGILLFVRGVAIAVLAALMGLIPVVGGVLATVFAVALTGWLVADELSSRALTARGIDYEDRRRLMRSHRARVLGFG